MGAAPPSTKLTVKDGLGEAAPYRDAAYGVQGPEGSKRAYLTSRTGDLNLEAKVKQRRVVTDATPLAQAGGYHCELCQCTLTDSSTWLDHINGTKHQRRLGVDVCVCVWGLTEWMKQRHGRPRHRRLGAHGSTGDRAAA